MIKLFIGFLVFAALALFILSRGGDIDMSGEKHGIESHEPVRKVTRDSEKVDVVKGEKRRRLHKAFLRYHDANHWPLLRDALKAMGRADLIGNGKHHLIPTWQPLSDEYQSARRKNSTPSGSPRKGQVLTQHTGLPPRKKR